VLTAYHVRDNEGDAAVEEYQKGDTEQGNAKEIGECLESRCRQCWEYASHGHGADDVDSVVDVMESL
jgi:hypothetical protein